MSLREEILNSLLEVYPFGTEIIHHTGEDEEYATEACDEIISIFEKRIDDELHELEMRTYDLEDLGEDDAPNETLSEYKIWKKVKEMLKS